MRPPATPRPLPTARPQALEAWQRRRRRGWRNAALTLGLIGLVAGGAITADRWGKPAPSGRPAPGDAPPEPLPDIAMPGNRALTPEAAVKENAAIPVSAAPIIAATPFVLPTVAAGPFRKSAIDCLTAAIYYEAAQEPPQGQAAVAQVILNRMRHPAYPKSICGVVYQGSERRTGCQFSFTCDGSLTRVPSVAGWTRARGIALMALSGRVERSVGLATHYHADYVVPYWAASLVKVAVIGRHLFYRWGGYWGERRAYTGRYQGEPGVTDGPSAVDAAIVPGLDGAVPGLSAADNATVVVPRFGPNADRAGPPVVAGGALATGANPVLDADDRRGKLTADEKVGTLDTGSRLQQAPAAQGQE